MNAFGKIYDAVLAAGKPFELPQVWHGYPCSDAFVELPTDSTSLRDSLAAEFPLPELVAAGVFAPGGELIGPLRVDQARHDKLIAVALHQRADAAPFALIAGMQLVGSTTIPLLAVLEDYRVK